MGQPAAAMDYDSDGGVFWRPRASPSHLHLPDGRRFPPSFRSPHWPELAARQHHMQREMQREVQREMQKQLQRELQHPGFHGVYPTLYDALMQKLMGHKGMAFGDGLGAGLGGSGLGGGGFGGGGLRGSGLDRGSLISMDQCVPSVTSSATASTAAPADASVPGHGRHGPLFPCWGVAPGTPGTPAAAMRASPQSTEAFPLNMVAQEGSAFQRGESRPSEVPPDRLECHRAHQTPTVRASRSPLDLLSQRFALRPVFEKTSNRIDPSYCTSTRRGAETDYVNVPEVTAVSTMLPVNVQRLT